MSFRDLPGLLAAINAVTEPLPDLLPVPLLCARPGCLVPVIPAISPYCTPECARLATALARGYADLGEHDEPDTLDEQDLAILHQVRANWPSVGPFIDSLSLTDQHALAEQLRPVVVPEHLAYLRARFDRHRARHTRTWEQVLREAARVADEQPSEILGAQLGPLVYVDEAFPDRPQDARVVPVDQLDTAWPPVLPSGRFGCNPMPVDHLTDAISYARLTEPAPGAAWIAGTSFTTPEDLARARALIKGNSERPADDPMLTGRWQDAASGPTEQAPAVDGNDQAAFALQPSSNDPVLDGRWDLRDHEGRVLPPDLYDAAWRQVGEDVAGLLIRPRPPWWRRLARALRTRKARP